MTFIQAVVSAFYIEHPSFYEPLAYYFHCTAAESKMNEKDSIGNTAEARTP